MRTLALLAALLLLALQAQAEPLRARVEEAPEQEQPGEEDQDMAISFAETEAPGLQRAGERPHQGAVWGRGRLQVGWRRERFSGSCFQDGKRYPLCCRRGW
uniref:Alpha-defensin N-terminal domain-containing protein n=1 Tax=Spermophilus dauricus TaxID=99837 RepID=A0A8C9PP06_SPEDA